MTLSDQKEQFSLAYIRAVAAATQVSVSEPVVDDDSIDLIFQKRGILGKVRSPRLEAQVKCTENGIPGATHVSYPLKLKNYDDLRHDDVLVPRILIVVFVPHDRFDWLKHDERELAMRHCGYWMSLRGQPATSNTASVSVDLPRVNQFTPVQLNDIMLRIGNGQLP